MTKAELVAAVAERAGLSKAQAGRAVDAVLDVVREAVARGEEVRVAGFGAFMVRERAARRGKNPQTGEELETAFLALSINKQTYCQKTPPDIT